jgi:nitroreductase
MTMQVDDVIRTRKTEKVLATHDLPTRDIRASIDEILGLAGLAPFHRACEESHKTVGMAGIEPWRFHVLDSAACRHLHPRLPKENAGKIPAMLAAADALIMATWLPNSGQATPMGDEPGFALTLANVEHIAAASAAIQNLLLAATARSISNYWSSGGVLRLPEVFELLDIPTNQILLGAIFLFPSEIGDSELAVSKLRPLRTPREQWTRWVTPK